MESETAIGYLSGIRQNVMRMGAISMSMALGAYGLPLVLDQSLRAAGGSVRHVGPMLTTDRMLFLAAAGVMACLVILPTVGLIMGMLGIYRQKKEIELSFLASVMHGTLLASVCFMVQGSSDVSTYLNIVQLAIGNTIV